VKKLILILVVTFLLLTASSFSKLPTFGIGLDYSYFNKHNQVMASVFKPRWFPIGISNSNLFKISLGLRAYNNLNPKIVYNTFLIKGDYYIHEPINLNPDYEPLLVGDPDYAFWKSYFGMTLLNFDNSQIEYIIPN